MRRVLNRLVTLLFSNRAGPELCGELPSIKHQSCSGRGQFTQFSRIMWKRFGPFFVSEGDTFVRRRQVPLLSNVYFSGRSSSYSSYSFQIPARFRLIIR